MPHDSCKKNIVFVSRFLKILPKSRKGDLFAVCLNHVQIISRCLFGSYLLKKSNSNLQFIVDGFETSNDPKLFTSNILLICDESCQTINFKKYIEIEFPNCYLVRERTNNQWLCQLSHLSSVSSELSSGSWRVL